MQALSPASRQISLALADSNPLVLGAMSEIFDRDPRFSLVATSSSAEGFLGAVMRVPVELGIIDWRIPALGGQKLIEVLRDQPNAPRLIVYGDDQNGELPRKSMIAGAAGFVARSTSVEKLVDTCLAVASGQMVFPFLDVRELQTDPIHQLTRREKSLLEALARGLTNRDLAGDFGISANTVKFHLSNLYEKLGVHSRAQAIAWFYSHQQSGDAGAARLAFTAQK
ncbi:response regulator transcription factor [Paracoccus sp. IB05]|uniref:response regulator transcription factor n=1 Tax=Paracoccus sp. IB05 TaxID=2779367 RepID=UPI0018E89286|nr:response regulator transcription factor [Paracoccus sp. IB05]MBJ2152361.1 response regulator transcription factor [Paracoccus sp. IB05]